MADTIHALRPSHSSTAAVNNYVHKSEHNFIVQFFVNFFKGLMDMLGFGEFWSDRVVEDRTSHSTSNANSPTSSVAATPTKKKQQLEGVKAILKPLEEKLQNLEKIDDLKIIKGNIESLDLIIMNRGLEIDDPETKGLLEKLRMVADVVKANPNLDFDALINKINQSESENGSPTASDLGSSTRTNSNSSTPTSSPSPSRSPSTGSPAIGRLIDEQVTKIFGSTTNKDKITLSPFDPSKLVLVDPVS